MFHEPAFATPAPHGPTTAMPDAVVDEEERGVDLVVSGHNHA